MQSLFPYLDEPIAHYQNGDLLKLLHLIEEHEGSLNPKALLYLSQKLNLPPARVYSTASFYAYFREKKGGIKHIQVCRCLSCHLNGAKDLIKELEEITNLKLGSSNEECSLEEVECLGLCDKAPAMLFDGHPVREIGQKADSTKT